MYSDVHALSLSGRSRCFDAAAGQIDGESMFRMFQVGIADAIAGRRISTVPGFVGALGETVGPNDAIT